MQFKQWFEGVAPQHFDLVLAQSIAERLRAKGQKTAGGAVMNGKHYLTALNPDGSLEWIEVDTKVSPREFTKLVKLYL